MSIFALYGYFLILSELVEIEQSCGIKTATIAEFDSSMPCDPLLQEIFMIPVGPCVKSKVFSISIDF